MAIPHAYKTPRGGPHFPRSHPSTAIAHLPCCVPFLLPVLPIARCSRVETRGHSFPPLGQDAARLSRVETPGCVTSSSASPSKQPEGTPSPRSCKKGGVTAAAAAQSSA